MNRAKIIGKAERLVAKERGSMGIYVSPQEQEASKFMFECIYAKLQFDRQTHSQEECEAFLEFYNSKLEQYVQMHPGGREVAMEVYESILKVEIYLDKVRHDEWDDDQ